MPLDYEVDSCMQAPSSIFLKNNSPITVLPISVMMEMMMQEAKNVPIR